MIENVTQKQLETEKEIQKIVLSSINKNISKDEANERIEKLLKNKVFSRQDINKYTYRRDNRNHVDFF